MERGRVELQPGTEDALELPTGPHEVRGERTLELGHGARVELRWTRGMSLLVDGPALLTLPAIRPGEVPSCRLDRARRVEWEARRAGASLELAEGWRLTLERGAARLEGLPEGGVAVRHHGGKPLRVATLVRRPPGSWPAVIAAGRGASLAPLPAE